jgi:hypothetical protein
MKARHVYLLYEVEKGPKGVDLQKIKKINRVSKVKPGWFKGSASTCALRRLLRHHFSSL